MGRSLLAFLFWCLGVAASSAQLPDLLDLPAQPGERALRGLMLDVTRAGARLVAVGEYGAIVYSDDSGKNWRQAAVPVQVTLTAVHFPSPQRGWAVGHDAVILHTEDGGATWVRQLDGRQTGDLLVAGAEAWAAELDAQVAAGELDGDELMLSQEANMMAQDEALREQEIGPNRPLLDVYFADEQRGFAIGAFNYFFVTEDGGHTWTDGSARLPNPEFLHLYSISPLADDTLLMVGEFGLLVRSRDGGVSWEALDIGYEGSLFSVTGDQSTAWIAGLRGNVFYSTDTGNSWQAVEVPTEASLLGAAVTGTGRASFVGLGGTLVEVDLAATPLVNLRKPAATSLAGVVGNDLGERVLVGKTGITHLDNTASKTPGNYIAGDS